MSIRRRVVALERVAGPVVSDSPYCQCPREYRCDVVWTVIGEPEPPAEVCERCGRPIESITIGWGDIEPAPESEVV